MTARDWLVAVTYVVQGIGYVGIVGGLVMLVRSGPRR